MHSVDSCNANMEVQHAPFSSSMPTKKVIQTEVDPVVYPFVLKTAEAKGLTLNEAARQALTEWAAREGDLSWDPLFYLSKTFTASHRTDASKVNEFVQRRRNRGNCSCTSERL